MDFREGFDAMDPMFARRFVAYVESRETNPAAQEAAGAVRTALDPPGAPNASETARRLPKVHNTL